MALVLFHVIHPSRGSAFPEIELTWLRPGDWCRSAARISCLHSHQHRSQPCSQSLLGFLRSISWQAGSPAVIVRFARLVAVQHCGVSNGFVPQFSSTDGGRPTVGAISCASRVARTSSDTSVESLRFPPRQSGRSIVRKEDERTTA